MNNKEHKGNVISTKIIPPVHWNRLGLGLFPHIWPEIWPLKSENSALLGKNDSLNIMVSLTKLTTGIILAMTRWFRYFFYLNWEFGCFLSSNETISMWYNVLIIPLCRRPHSLKDHWLLFKGSPDQNHYIFLNQCRKRRIRHITTLNLNLHWISESLYVGSTSIRHWFEKYNDFGLNYP